MLVKVKPYELVGAGEFVDKESGEVIKWGAGFWCWVHLPDFEYPVQLKLPDESKKMAIGVECTWDFALDVKKGVIRVKKSFVKTGYDNVKL